MQVRARASIFFELRYKIVTGPQPDLENRENSKQHPVPFFAPRNSLSAEDTRILDRHPSTPTMKLLTVLSALVLSASGLEIGLGCDVALGGKPPLPYLSFSVL